MFVILYGVQNGRSQHIDLRHARSLGRKFNMIYTAIITIFDENDNKITTIQKEENKQIEHMETNSMIHEFWFGSIAIFEKLEDHDKICSS